MILIGQELFVLLVVPIYNIYLIMTLFLLIDTLGVNSYGEDPILNP